MYHTFYISYSSNIKAGLKMFAPNRHDRLIEGPKTRYPQMPFLECEINQIHRMVFISLTLLKLLTFYMKFYISYSSNIKAGLKMFAPNRHDRLIEGPKTRYPQMPFLECEINQIHRMVFISLTLLKLLTFRYVYSPVYA